MKFLATSMQTLNICSNMYDLTITLTNHSCLHLIKIRHSSYNNHNILGSDRY